MDVDPRRAVPIYRAPAQKGRFEIVTGPSFSGCSDWRRFEAAAWSPSAATGTTFAVAFAVTGSHLGPFALYSSVPTVAFDRSGLARIAGKGKAVLMFGRLA